MRRIRVLARFLLIISAPGALAQGVTPAVRMPAVQPTGQSLEVSFGIAVPHSREGVTRFWRDGWGGSAKFMVNVSRPLAFGAGVDVVWLAFDEREFAIAYPGVAVRSRNLSLASPYVGTKYSLMPHMRFNPFVGFTIGATTVSEAVYREVIDSVRVTYYSIPGRTRLTFGCSLGADVYVTHWLSLDMEVKLNYVHHDPDLGLATLARGGFRFAF